VNFPFSSKRYKVKNILWTGVIRNTAEYKEWEGLIEQEEKEGARIFIARSGQKTPYQNLRFGTAQVILEILYPFEVLEGKEFKDSNDTSVVLKLSYGERSFLFAGDAEKQVEKKLMENKADLDSDVLKTGHHGSKTSSSEEFVAKVSPEIAVISAGRNNQYGHPHQEVLDVFNKYGIKIFRTDKDGDIKIISDGKNYAVSNFQN